MIEDFDKYLANNKTYISDFDITKHIVLDNESNYWYSAEYVDKMLKKQDKEIERLNNIINELEKYLRNEEAEYDRLYEEQDEQEYLDKYFATRNVLNKLQELKGSDKE